MQKHTLLLPEKLILQIISNLSSFDQGTLAALCLVSKSFHRITSPQLWRWVHLPITLTSGNEKDNSSIDNNVNVRYLWPTYHTRYTKFLTIHHLSNLLSTEKYLHSSSTFPNLQTLHLENDPKCLTLLSCLIKKSLYPDQNSKNLNQIFLEQLKPENLVLRNVSTMIVNFYLNCTPRNFHDDVITLIFTSSSFEKYQIGGHPLFLPNFPSLKRIYWIFDPIATPPSGHTNREWYKLNLWIVQELILQLPNTPINIVNVGSTIIKDPNRKYMSMKNTQNDAEKTLWEGVKRISVEEPSFWSEIDLGRRKESVKFQNLEEFIESGDWEDWFDIAEVASWRRAVGQLPS